MDKATVEDKKFYTIGEVSKILETDQHVIRFWSSQFNQYIKPRRTAGQRRSYSKKDLEMLKTIKDLLYIKGLSIKGAHLLLKEKNGYNKLLANEKNPALDNILKKLNALSTKINNKIS